MPLRLAKFLPARLLRLRCVPTKPIFFTCHVGRALIFFTSTSYVLVFFTVRALIFLSPTEPIFSPCHVKKTKCFLRIMAIPPRRPLLVFRLTVTAKRVKTCPADRAHRSPRDQLLHAMHLLRQVFLLIQVRHLTNDRRLVHACNRLFALTPRDCKCRRLPEAFQPAH